MRKRWYVVETKPQSERLAFDQLKAQRFSPFLPTQSTGRPFFPRYLFVRLNLKHQRWQAVSNTRGVKRMLGGEMPQSLPDHEIAIILALSDVPVEDIPQAMTKLINGASVRIGDGPFEGHTGKVEWNDHKRVGVLLTLFGRATTIAMDRTVRLYDAEASYSPA